MTENAFPVRAWPDICSAYRDGDLAKACLALQEAFAIDVPLLLVLSLADRAGYGIASVSVDDLVRGAAAWRETVIVPLRQARQGMKLRFTAPAEAALREGIKRLELEAEHQHVLRLVDALPPPIAEVGAASHYLSASGLTADAADDFIQTFKAACAAQIASFDHE